MKKVFLMPLLFAFFLVGCTLNAEPVVQEIKKVRVSQDVFNMLQRNNEIRASVYAGYSLTWSTALAKTAQAHADTLARTNVIKHSSTKHGENLFASSNKTNYLTAINSWHKEKKNYNFKTKQCKAGKTCGHYTQIVWKNTREVGCGKASNPSWGTIVICQYSLRGNIAGEKAF